MIRKHFFLLLFFTLFYVCGFSQNLEIGIASYYHDKFEGRTTASGEIFQQHKFTAAHKTLPFNTKVKVTNLKNNKSVVVKINDRGPFVEGRIIDLSQEAAFHLQFLVDGIADVKVEILSSNKN